MCFQSNELNVKYGQHNALKYLVSSKEEPNGAREDKNMDETEVLKFIAYC
jgi:hypothetical protein